MNLKQCKDQIASIEGYENWHELRNNPSDLNSGFFELIVNKIATLYAIEKVKEALQLAAQTADTFVIEGVNSQAILSLETELVNNIKNEK